MRCHICNSTLGESEVKFNKDHNDWEPCQTCLLAIAEIFEDPLDEEEIDRSLEEELENYYNEIENSP